jgi:hypothetical protein
VSSPEDLERRIAAVEAKIVAVRREAAAARALAAGADRDVAEYHAELRGHGRVLSALRATQLEQQEFQLQLQETQLQLRETQLRHYAEHKADAAEMKAGLFQIVRMLEDLGGNGRTAEA